MASWPYCALLLTLLLAWLVNLGWKTWYEMLCPFYSLGILAAYGGLLFCFSPETESSSRGMFFPAIWESLFYQVLPKTGPKSAYSESQLERFLGYHTKPHTVAWLLSIKVRHWLPISQSCPISLFQKVMGKKSVKL